MKTGESASEKSKKEANKTTGTVETAAGTTAAPTTTDASTKTSAKKKKRSNLFLRVGEKVGVVEQTRIAPEFMAEIDKYFKYYDVADDLVDGLEGVLQQNPRILASGKIEAPENQDPFEETSQSARLIQQMYAHEPETNKVMGIIADCFKSMGTMHREIQLNGRRTIRKLRRFVSTNHSQMLEEQQKLMLARDIMDSARHDLKQTKTSDELEHFGKLYESCVHDFDVQAAKVEAFTLVLPYNKVWHHREVYEYFDLLGKHHRAMVTTLDTHMASALQLVPSEFVQKNTKTKSAAKKKK